MKRVKRWLSISVMAVLIFSMGITNVFADSTTYSVWVKGTQVTSDNASNVLNDGTVSYDAESNTLTLKNASLSVASGENASYAIEAPAGVNIELLGNNTISSTGITMPPVYSNNGAIIIKGAGTLDITGQAGTISAKGLLTIDGATVKSVTTGNGFLGMESKTGMEIINNANVNVTTNGAACLQCANPNQANGPYIKITDSVVNTDSGDSWSVSAASNITITDSEVSAEGIGVAIGSDFGDVIISNSVVEAISTGSEGNGIYTATGKINISDGSVVATEGAYPAMYGKNGIAISDSVVEAASSGDVAIFSPVDITVEDSDVSASAPEGKKGILSKGTTAVSGSWIETTGTDDNLGTVTDSIVIKGIEGTVTGEVELISDITIPEGTTLTVPENSVLVISEGVTVTNNGAIENNGTVILNGTLNGNAIDSGENGVVTHTKHSFSDQWSSDETYHWHECIKEGCTLENSEKEGYTEHTFTEVIDKAATATETGLKHKECEECGYNTEAIVIPATGTTDTTGSGDSTKTDSTGTDTSDTEANQSAQTRDDFNMLPPACAALAAAIAATVALAGRKNRS